MKKKALKHFKKIMICGVFIFFIGLNIVIVQTHAYATATATSTLAIINVLSTDTPVSVTPPPTATPVPPTATPVPPTATPVPPTATPVPPTATPVPTPMPTTVPPTQPAQQAIPPVDPGDTGNPPPTVTPTKKATATPTPTATATPDAAVTPTATAVVASGNAQDQATTQGSGMGGLLIPIAFGSVFLLLIIGLIGFMFLRKPKPQKLAYGRFARQTARPTPWLNRPDPDATFALPGVEQQAAFAVSTQINTPMQPTGPVIAMPTGSHKAITPTPPPLYNDPHRTISMSTGPQKAITPRLPPLPNDLHHTIAMPTGPQPATRPAFREADAGYIPGNLKPISGQIAETLQKNPVSTSDMSPLPLDNFDLSQVLPKEAANNGIRWDAPGGKKESQISFSPLIAPNVQDDPVLETIMRQAQMGLYALPNQDQAETDASNDDSFLP